jgi:succinate-semialdehyde dehydrogenase/glutarate-semialdehyde dehydrogenase
MTTTTPSGMAGASQRPTSGYATVNPATGETVATFESLGAEDVEPLVQAAHAAFLQWRERSVAERAAVVGRAAEIMMERENELAAAITLEMGKLIGEAHFEVHLAASILRYYADNGPTFLEPEPLHPKAGEAVVVNAPLGVLLGVEPWNFPLYQVVRFAGPNLVVGNTILLKHASNCPQSALALEAIFRDAGAPDGVYTNIFLPSRHVAAVIQHPLVQGVSLTGSEAAGAAVGEAAGRSLKKCVLELGGSDPFIVLDAPDLGTVVRSAAIGRLANTGQSCVAAKRFIVRSEVYQSFVQALTGVFASLQPGDPADPSTTLGPVSSEMAADDLVAQVADALEKGATLHTGGERLDRPGAFLAATVLTGVEPGMRAYQEELFGPVAVVYEVQTDEEAIELANVTSFGLGGSVFCSDPERARAVADRVESGMVWINHPTSSEPELPFGGVKRSGFGRELSHLGMFEFTNRKLIRSFPAQTDTGQIAG